MLYVSVNERGWGSNFEEDGDSRGSSQSKVRFHRPDQPRAAAEEGRGRGADETDRS